MEGENGSRTRLWKSSFAENVFEESGFRNKHQLLAHLARNKRHFLSQGATSQGKRDLGDGNALFVGFDFGQARGFATHKPRERGVSGLRLSTQNGAIWLSSG